MRRSCPTGCVAAPEFAIEHPSPGAVEQVFGVIRGFRLVTTAGGMVANLGILPWESGDATRRP
jgi:hypothetical protein